MNSNAVNEGNQDIYAEDQQYVWDTMIVFHDETNKNSVTFLSMFIILHFG